MNKMKQWFNNRKANEQTIAPSGISRRQFLKVGLVAAMASTLLPTLAGRIHSVATGERATAVTQISELSNVLTGRSSDRQAGQNRSLASLAMCCVPFVSLT